MAVHCKKNSRRNQRKKRIQLSVGDTDLSGKVVVFNQNKLCGFIQPDPINGRRAARIWFSWWQVPPTREKCVGVGTTVYFSVAQGSKGRIKAVVQ